MGDVLCQLYSMDYEQLDILTNYLCNLPSEEEVQASGVTNLRYVSVGINLDSTVSSFD
jgi:hypothetical protein